MTRNTKIRLNLNLFTQCNDYGGFSIIFQMMFLNLFYIIYDIYYYTKFTEIYNKKIIVHLTNNIFHTYYLKLNFEMQFEYSTRVMVDNNCMIQTEINMLSCRDWFVWQVIRQLCIDIIYNWVI